MPDEAKELLKGKVAILTQPEKTPVFLLLERKLYWVEREMSDEERMELSMPIWDLMVKEMGQEKVQLKVVGTKIIKGHKCIKILATNKEKPEKVFIYVATDLKNLIIRMEMWHKGLEGTLFLDNITFDIPEDSFEIPADFKEFKSEAEHKSD